MPREEVRVRHNRSAVAVCLYNEEMILLIYCFFKIIVE